MSLLVNRGETITQPYKAGTYSTINFRLQKGTASGTGQTIDLTKINFGLKYYQGNGSSHEIVRYTNLFVLLMESQADFSNPMPGAEISFDTFADRGEFYAFSINLEGYIQCVGNDYLDANLQVQTSASTDDFSVTATLPKSCGVMDSIPTIDVIQVQNGVVQREEYLGDDVTRITLCTSGAEVLTQCVLNSDKLSPILEAQDIAIQTDEFSSSNTQTDSVVYGKNIKGKIIFTGDQDDVEIDNVSVNLSFDSSTTGSWLVVRRNKTSRALVNYANTLRNKHMRKTWGKKA